MTSFIIKKSWLLGLATAILWSCSGSSDSQKEDPSIDVQAKNRTEMLTNIADNIILPSYANFKVKLDAMTSKSDAFTTKPDAASLTEFRQAWVDAYTEWQKVEGFEFGPADKYVLRNYFNIYPANVTGITSDIADPASNLEVPAAYDRQGFPALDYLINGVGATDAAIVAFYTAAGEGTKRTAHVKRLTARMSSVFGKVLAEWTSGYRDTFVSKTGLDIGSSTSIMINAYVLYYERYIRSGKFGIPSGAMANGVPAAEKVEAFYKKDLSLTLAKTAHQSVIDFFNGKNAKTGVEGPSLKTYLNALGAKDAASGKALTEIILAQFDVSKKKLDTLSPNLYEQVKTNNQLMKDTYTEMQKVVRMLKVDLTSAISVTITYTDNDGD